MTTTQKRLRSLHFLPGNRPDLLAKVSGFGPDAVVLDLEDAVAPDDKAAARESVAQALAARDPKLSSVLVRVNPPGSPWFEGDLAQAAMLIGAGRLDGVVLPKYEEVGQLVELRAMLPGTARVVVGLESALGVADVRALLALRPEAAYFGAEDYAGDLGARRTAEGLEVLYARSQVVLACRLAEVVPIDQAVVSVRDVERFRADAAVGLGLGYRGKICLHPLQVAAAHDIFTPDAAAIEHARAVLQAVGAGVGVVDGAMVDEAHANLARRVLAQADEI